MQKMLNLMKMQSYAADGTRSHTQIATVSAYDPVNHAGKVIFQPDGQESGWMPIMTQWSGNGWGMFSPPSIGDMVHVHPIDGNFESGTIGARAFNDEDRPANIPSGEWALIHKTGAKLHFNNDGSVSMQATTLTLTGNLVVTGDVSDKNGSMQEMRDDYNPHTHGGGPTPEPQMT